MSADLARALQGHRATERWRAHDYRWFRISPRRLQAWRGVNELPDRELMRDGRWST